MLTQTSQIRCTPPPAKNESKGPRSRESVGTPRMVRSTQDAELATPSTGSTANGRASNSGWNLSLELLTYIRRPPRRLRSILKGILGDSKQRRHRT